MTATDALPLVEEELSIDKRQVATGRVRISTITDLVEERVQLDLTQDEVRVLRVPIDRIVDAPPAIRTEGDVTIIPVIEEIMVVERRLLLKEELHVTRQTTTTTTDVPVSLRKQRAIVERLPTTPSED